MALWNNTTAPKWLLGKDTNLAQGDQGLGNNGVKNDKDIAGVALEDGDELSRADDQAGVGWRVWHSKDNGNNIGEGRGWWEILATQDVTGTAVDSGGPVAGVIGAISVAVANIGDDVNVTLSATDEDGHAITYSAGAAAVNCTGTITDSALVISLAGGLVDGDVATFSWKATANGVDTANQTITINIIA